MIEAIKARVRKRHIILLTLLGLSAIGSVFYFQHDTQDPPGIIRAYQDEKDYEPIVRLVNQNKFMLSERNSFSAEKMLKIRAPGDDLSRKGLAAIDVIEYDQQTAGFIAYYKQSSSEGVIWLLGVDKNFRGLGLANQLVLHAVEQLKKRKAKYISLYTRTINKPALNLYKKHGFRQLHRMEQRGMVQLIKEDL